MELQGLSDAGAPPGASPLAALRQRPSRRLRRGLGALLCLLVLGACLPAGALAWSPPGQTYPQSAPPGTPALVSSMTTPPAGYRLTGGQVLALARANGFVHGQLQQMAKLHLVPYVYTRGGGVWQVSWFTPPSIKTHPQWEEIQVYVVDSTGEVSQAWTGYQVAWTMARGYPGAFGRVVNHLWIWLPLCALFLAPFIPWRRRPTLWHLDLLVLLGFSLSLAWFNHANLGLSVPTIYPFMVYLMIRLGLLAFGIGRPRSPLRVVIPTAWMAILIIFLIGFRVGLNITDSNVIDVGYAGTIGGYKILHGQKLYGNPASAACSSATVSTKECWPNSNGAGDTYGPINYLAYVPAVGIFGWSGVWDSLPASHAAAIAFDLLTMLGLFFLGRRIRGPSFGVILAYLWAAYPFTLYTLSSNSNDSLVALMTVATLLVATSAPARGVFAAFAGLTKFGPFVLAPLMLRGVSAPARLGTGDAMLVAVSPAAVGGVEGVDGAVTTDPGQPAGRPRRDGGVRRFRGPVVYCVAFALAVLLPMLLVLLNHDLSDFWNDTIKYQTSRPAPFSIWGLWGDTFGGVTSKLIVEQRIWQGLTVLAALLVVIFPRGPRSVVQVAALGGALIIAVECCLAYWFYLYIPWFFALVIVALVLAHPTVESVVGREPVRDVRQPEAPVPAPA